MKNSRLHEILKLRGLSLGRLSSAVGIPLRTLYNISCGIDQSRPARQKITDYLSATIWEDVRVNTVVTTLSSGTEMGNMSARGARALHEIFPDSTSIIADGVRFIEATEVLFDFRNSRPPPRAHNCEIGRGTARRER